MQQEESTISLKRRLDHEESLAREEAVRNTIVCFEKWDMARLNHIKTLNLPPEIKRTLNIHFEPGAPRIRINYSTLKGDTKGRVYARVVKHSDRYKRRKIEKEGAYIYESDAHPREEDMDGGGGLQSLCGWIRKQVAHANYRDYDISNCAPTLLQQILEKAGLCPRELVQYNTQRDAIFKRYAHIATQGEVKKAFLVVLHMGATDDRFPETWRLKNALKASLIRLSKSNLEYGQLYDRCMVACRYKYQKRKYADMVINLQNRTLGKFCATVWNRVEHQVLMSMREYFVNVEHYDAKHMVLCFDGIMIEKKIPEEKVDFDALCLYVEEQTSFHVKIEEKSLMPSEKDMAFYNGTTPIVCKEKKKNIFH